MFLLRKLHKAVLFPAFVGTVALCLLGLTGPQSILLMAGNINPPQFASFSTPTTTTYTIPARAQSLEVWLISAGGGGWSCCGAARRTR